MPIAEHIIMDEEDARAALVAENKQLKEKLAKYELKERMKQADMADKKRGGYRRRTPRDV